MRMTTPFFLKLTLAAESLLVLAILWLAAASDLLG